MLLQNAEAFLKLLKRIRIPYCIIGGIAVLLHGGRASTIDFDLYVLLQNKDKLTQELKKAKIKFTLLGEEQLRVHYEKIIVDILIADPLLGEQVLARASEKKLGKTRVKVATPEDLIIMKSLADRPVDRRDIAELEEIYGENLDRHYIFSMQKAIRSKGAN